MYHLQDLAQSRFACEEDENRDVDDCIGALSRNLARYAREFFCVYARGAVWLDNIIQYRMVLALQATDLMQQVLLPQCLLRQSFACCSIHTTAA